MQVNTTSIINDHLHLISGDVWADRLESIEYLKGLRKKEDVMSILYLAISLDGFHHYHELIQVFEAIVKDSDDLSSWQGAFFGLFELKAIFKKGIQNKDEESIKYYNITEETIENLIAKLIEIDISTQNTRRPALVFSFVNIWSLLGETSKTLMVRKIIKFKIRELYHLTIEGLEIVDKKTAINILRVLLHAKEKRLVPALKKWIKSNDQEKRIEALRAMSRVGGLFELQLIYKYLEDKNDQVRIEACICFIELLPFAKGMVLRSFWEKENSQKNKQELIKFLGTKSRRFSLLFLYEILLLDSNTDLEDHITLALGKIRHPVKLKVMTRNFSALNESQKLNILVSLKGRAYGQLEEFYLKELQRQTNPLLLSLILESLSGFPSKAVTEAIYNYLLKVDDYTVGEAFHSLVKINRQLACDFVCKTYLERDQKNSGLTVAFLKSIPLLSQYLELNPQIEEFLRSTYHLGSETEKTLLLRALPYIPCKSLFQLFVEEFPDLENEAKKSLMASSIIKSSFLKRSLVQYLIPLMDNGYFLKNFKNEKLKVSFVEELGRVSIKNDIENTKFMKMVINPALNLFLKEIDKFYDKTVILFFLELLKKRTGLVKEEHFEKIKAHSEITDDPILKEAFQSFLLLRGDLDSLVHYLKFCRQRGMLLPNQEVVKLSFGGFE